ncbi:MAG: protein kinase [Myxococcales bacterium]|nr:protein kinase [Myxococcales bacterium]
MADRDSTEPAPGTSPFSTAQVDAAVDQLRDGDATATATMTSPPPGPRRRRLPRMDRGTVIGRYVVIDLLGQGGMGDVYAAYDPELDRRVALKLVRDLTGQGRERLIAEAKAMARVSHPNVCAVHDAGRFAEGVFIAMELVDGQTLTEWRRTPRSWREIVTVFAAAGAGLCAAHAAGIVHRDFAGQRHDRPRRARARARLRRGPGRRDGRGARPRDARQRARPRRGRQPADPRQPGHGHAVVHGARAAASRRPRRPRRSVRVRGGAVRGAVRPERPFAGDHADEIADNALAYRVRPPPRERDVPAWLRRPLLRRCNPSPAIASRRCRRCWSRWPATRRCGGDARAGRRGGWAPARSRWSA